MLSLSIAGWEFSVPSYHLLLHLTSRSASRSLSAATKSLSKLLLSG